MMPILEANRLILFTSWAGDLAGGDGMLSGVLGTHSLVVLPCVMWASLFLDFLPRSHLAGSGVIHDAHMGGNPLD